jgi:hypothetical protein
MNIALLGLGALVVTTCLWPLIGLLLLLSLLILGDRQGGHLHALIGTFPVYITEAVLAALFIRLVVTFRPRQPQRQSVEYPWLGFYIVSALSAARGFLLYGPMLVIRDSALVYYSFFTHFLKGLLSKDISKLKLIGLVLAHVVLVKAILTYSNWGFFYQEGSAVSMYFLCTVILSMMTYPLWSRCYWWYPALTFLSYQVIVIVFRSSWMGLIAGLVFFVVMSWRYRFSMSHRLVTGFLVFLGVILGLVCPPKERFQKPVGRTNLAQMTRNLKDTVDIETHHYLIPYIAPSTQPKHKGQPHQTSVLDEPKPNQVLSQFRSFAAGIDSNNSSTRVWFAQDLLEEVLSIRFPYFLTIRMAPESLALKERGNISRQLAVPFILESERQASWRKTLGWGSPWMRRLFGIPFGKTFLPPRVYYWMDKVGRFDPHNSFLSIFYRIGIIGFFFFLWIIGSEVRRTSLRIKSMEPAHQLWLLGIWGAFIGLCVEAMFSVSLENAFKGIFFWIFLGCIRALNREPKTTDVSA